jgi:hypothetical protein
MAVNIAKLPKLLRNTRQSATWTMSALGQKQTSRSEIIMSALPPKANIS